MKRKRLALLLAGVMMVTSLDSAAVVASGADFSSDPVQTEQTVQQDAEASVQSEDGASQESADADFTDSVTYEAEDEEPSAAEAEVISDEEENAPEVQTEGEDEEPDFTSEESEIDLQSASDSIVPTEGITELTPNMEYQVDIDTPGKAVWFSYTPDKDAEYRLVSTSEEGVDPRAFLYDRADVSNWYDYAATDDDGKGSSNDFLLSYELKAGTTYYYSVQLYNSSDTGSFSVAFREKSAVSSIEVSNTTARLAAGFDKAGKILKDATVTVNYADGSAPYVHEYNGTDYCDVFSDEEGNQITAYWLNNGEAQTFDSYSTLTMGTHTLMLRCGDVSSNEISAQAVLPTEIGDRYKGEFREGDNEPYVTRDDIFTFTPSESGKYGFRMSVSDTSAWINLKYNDNGEFKDASAEDRMYVLEAGTTYYGQPSNYDGTVRIQKCVPVESVDIDLSGVRTEFVEKLDYTYLLGMKLTVNYTDGRDSEELTYHKWENSKLDSYGNIITYYFTRETENGLESDMGGGNRDAGVYSLRVDCNNTEMATLADCITVQGLDTLDTLSVGSNHIESPDDWTKWYRITVPEEGRYQFSPVGILEARRDYGYGMFDVTVSEGTCYFDPTDQNYVGFSGGREAENGEDINEWNVEIKKCPKLTSMKYSESTIALSEAVDALSYDSMIPKGELTLEYDDGTTDTIHPKYAVGIEDSYGNRIETTMIDQSTGKAYDWGSDWYSIAKGTYTLTFSSGSVASASVELKVQAIDFDKYEKLSLGSNTIQIGEEMDDLSLSAQTWYGFEPEKTGEYKISMATGYERDWSWIWRCIDKDGNVSSEYPEWGQYGYQLQKGVRYLVCWQSLAGAYTDEVIIKKVPEIVSAKVTGHDPENLTFIKGMETVHLNNLYAEIVYDDGTTEKVDMDGWDDEYDRSLECVLTGCKDADGKYPDIWDGVEDIKDLPAGDYVYRVSYGDYHIEDIPVKIVDPSDVADAEIKGDTDLVNKDKMILKYTPAETARYEIRFNVPVTTVKVITEDGQGLESSSVEEFRAYANMEKGTTYYLYVKANEYCPELNVKVSPVTRPSNLETKALKKTYIAGIDHFDSAYMQTKVSYEGSDKGSYTTNGNAAVGGYYLQYEVSNKETNQVLESYEPMTVGTWVVKPYLSASIQTGSAVAAEMADIPVVTDEVTAEKLDLTQLPAFTLNEWKTLENSSFERKFYSFTAEEAGTYIREFENQGTVSSMVFYRDGEDGYEFEGSTIELEKGESCLIEVLTTDAMQGRVVKESAVDPVDPVKPDEISELTLEPGMKKAVSLSAGKQITCTFTPEEDGDYVLESSEYDDWVDTFASLEWEENEDTYYEDDDDGGRDNHFRLKYHLKKGITYTYTVRFYSNKTSGSFYLNFYKAESRKIAKVELVVNEEYEGKELSVLDAPDQAYEILVTYEDGTTASFGVNSGRYSDENDNVLDIAFASTNSVLDKEVNFTITVKYHAKDEQEWKKTEKQFKTKGLGAFTFLELDKEYAIKANALDRLFKAPETGEYMITVNEAVAGQNGIGIKGLSYASDTFNEYGVEFGNGKTLSYEGESTYSVHLVKDEIYRVENYASLTSTDTFKIYKAAKTLKGLKLLTPPEQTTCVADGVNVVSLKGLKVQASYTDGSTETITYGEADSSGRHLYHDGVEWLNATECRAYARLGKYRVSFELKAAPRTAVQITENQEYKAKAEKGDTFVLKIIPQKDYSYWINITNGRLLYIKGENAADDVRVREWQESYYLHAGKTYYLYVHADAANPVVNVSTESGCVWQETLRIPATCTTDGKVVEICSRHGEDRETILPALGHSWNAGQVTVTPTTTREGEIVYTCTRCGEVKKEKLNKLIAASLSVDKKNAVSGETVTLTAKAEGGSGSYTYKFLICDASGNWYKLRDFESSNTLKWKTGSIGKKTLYVDVKDSTGTVKRAELAYEVVEANALTAELSASPSGSAVSGTEVKLSAKASGGKGNYTYKFLVCDASGNWYKLRDFGSSSELTWKTGSVGKKTLYVDVKDAAGTVKRAELAYEVKSQELTATLSASPSGSVVSGNQVTLSAKANGGSGSYTYKFLVCDASGNWYKLRDFAGSSTFTWKTGSAGKKTLYVDVKDSEGTVKRAELAYEVKSQELTATLSASPSGSAVSGTEVKLSAKASGGSGSYTYKFLVCDASGNWYKLRDFGSSSELTWKTGSAGKKMLYVDVKDAAGTVKRAELVYEVKSQELTAELSASPSGSVVSGEQVTLSAKANGGSGSYTYKFLVCDASGNWYKLRDFGSSSTFTWKTGTAGKKTLYVDVKDAAGTVKRAELTYEVKSNELTATLSASPSGSAVSGTEVKLSAKASGGSGSYTYKFLVCDASGNWYKLRDFGSSSTLTWKTGATGKKMLYVDVKDAAGTVKRAQINYEVK
ncbi:hypothetical protein [Blautia sp. MSJ-19]|uniref:hypothetical protein n=1 Tax=Blautia sp. MSJ-19 TaxID=2841517 RepID=UPI001C0F3A2A|nr:hypothetical protein [Blautia sp. MSJ-19]MBU5480126.1 hypothetical protein [Blautia sp. MSJ-19]